MLTDYQFFVVILLSGGIWLGVIGGAVVGALVGALISSIRTHRFVNFIPGAIKSVLPAIALSVVISVPLLLFEILLAQPGYKNPWYAPSWMLSFRIGIVFVAGSVGAMLAQRPGFMRLRSRGVISWTIVGAFLGAFGNLLNSFDGYFAEQSNELPIRYAITGFLFGGTVALVWCLIVRAVQKREFDELGKTTGQV